jgi:hypothetical protein
MKPLTGEALAWQTPSRMRTTRAEHGSWLECADMANRRTASRCRLDRPIPDMSTLKREVSAWEERRNKACSKVIWHFTTADARIKLRRLYPVVKEQNLT